MRRPCRRRRPSGCSSIALRSRGPFSGSSKRAIRFLLRPFAEAGGMRVARQRRAAGDVRILVGGHDLPFFRAACDQGDRVGGLAPGAPARRLQVRDVDRQSRLAADRQRLVDRRAGPCPRRGCGWRRSRRAAPRPSPGRSTRRSRLGAGIVDQGPWTGPRRRPSCPGRRALPCLFSSSSVGARLALPMTALRRCVVRHLMDDVGAELSRLQLLEIAGHVDGAGAAVAGDRRGHALNEIIQVGPRAGSQNGASLCVCRSMKPGAATRPLPSMIRGCPATVKLPMATMRSPLMARSPTRPGCRCRRREGHS